MPKFIITVYLSNGEVWETFRDTFEDMNNYCKALHTDGQGNTYWAASSGGGVRRYTVEEVSI